MYHDKGGMDLGERVAVTREGERGDETNLKQKTSARRRCKIGFSRRRYLDSME
jgi:hypothetical protein